jgi:hypothetical protein
MVRQISLGLAEPRRTYTHAFERYVLELSRYMTILDVADHLGVSWDIVKDIQKRHLRRHYAKPSLKDVRQIAIDEICVGRGYRFAIHLTPPNSWPALAREAGPLLTRD